MIKKRIKNLGKLLLPLAYLSIAPLTCTSEAPKNIERKIFEIGSKKIYYYSFNEDYTFLNPLKFLKKDSISYKNEQILERNKGEMKLGDVLKIYHHFENSPLSLETDKILFPEEIITEKKLEEIILKQNPPFIFLVLIHMNF